MRSMVEREERQSAGAGAKTTGAGVSLSTSLRLVPLSQEGEDQPFFRSRIAAQRSRRSLTLASWPWVVGL